MEEWAAFHFLFHWEPGAGALYVAVTLVEMECVEVKSKIACTRYLLVHLMVKPWADPFPKSEVIVHPLL